MRRTAPLLYGLAITSVVLNHANWHALSQYGAGQTGGYWLVVVDQVGKFAIAAFIFIAGYFSAYATSGGKHGLPWKIVFARLEGLLWPWLFWSAVLTLGQWLMGSTLSLLEFLRAVFIQYYFVPLLAFYYLAAPFLAQWAKEYPRRLLLGAAGVQLVSIAIFYARVYHPGFPGILNSWVDLGPLQYLRFAFYFPFGMVCGMFPREVKAILSRFQSALPWIVMALFCLSVVEASWAYAAGGDLWPIGGDQTKLSSALFSVSLLLYFIAFDRLRLPFAKAVSTVGTHSYGIYLVHYIILGATARVVQRLLPWAAAQPWLLVPLLFAFSLGLALVLMEGMNKRPTKRFYRYLFG